MSDLVINETGSPILTETEGDAAYAPIAEGVTNGDSHDHNGGDGAQIDHTGLSNVGTNTHAQIDTAVTNSVSHIAQTATPHGATDANTASRLVARDASNNFAAGTISAALTGTASGNDVLGAAAAVQSNLTTHESDTAAPHGATSANTASRIITRDGSGNFSAGTMTGDVTGTASGNDVLGAAASVQTNLTTHEGNTSDPHSVTAAQASAAPDTITCWTSAAEGALSAENNVGALGNGIVKHASGVPALAIANTDYLAVGGETLTSVDTNHFVINTKQLDFSVVGETIEHMNNGIILETIDPTIASDGATITFSLEKAGGGNLTLWFSDHASTFVAAPATVVITAGTTASPVERFVYIPQSTKTLTEGAAWPATEHARIATVVVQSATDVQNDGALKLHAWTDHVVADDGRGHLLEAFEWMRSQHATWLTGVALTPTITVNGGAEDNINIATTSGTIKQLHTGSAMPAFDTSTGSFVKVVNFFGANFTKITDLNAADEDSAGNAIGNNDRTNIVVWGDRSEASGDCNLFANLPSDFYGSDQAALDDASRFSNFTIPAAYKGTGFLISLLTFKFRTAAGGTWTLIRNEDLRGQFPSITAGGAAAASTEFADSTFRIQDDGDLSKEVAFEASGLTTGTTRTLTVQDADGTIAYLADIVKLTNMSVVEDHTGADVLTAAEDGSLHTNRGAGGNVALTLESAAAGLEFFFAVVANQNLVVTAAGGDTMRIAAAVSSAGGTLTSNTVGDVLHLKCLDGTEWIAFTPVLGWVAA